MEFILGTCNVGNDRRKVREFLKQFGNCQLQNHPCTGKINEISGGGVLIINSYPANIYLFKVNNRNTRKGGKYVQS